MSQGAISDSTPCGRERAGPTTRGERRYARVVTEWSCPPRRENPTDEEWERTKERFPLGALVDGKVVACQPFGVFLDLGGDAVGLVETPALPSRFSTPGSRKIAFPELGEELRGWVVRHRDSDRQVEIVAEDPVDDFYRALIPSADQ